MAEVFELPTDIPEVVLREFVTPMHPEPPDMTRFGIWDTEIDEGSTLVGGVDITPRGEDAAEVDFLVHADHVGHGYAKAAAKAAAEHAALVYDRVFAHVLDSNFAGISVLEGAGFRQTRRETLAGEATRLIFDFGAKDIVELLAPGEDLEFEPQPRGSQGRAHGYNYAAIKNNTHTEGDSVVLTVEPGGSVEPVLITGDITLSVVSLKWLACEV
jgi:RimJ/RimL family protein N-acetyltransferase